MASDSGPLIMLGKYELVERIGEGSFGTVYRTRETALDVERAVKVLHPLLSSNPVFIERFRREAQTAARLEHPAITPVYQLNETGGHYYLAMKYMAGGSLKDRLASGDTFSYNQALEIPEQVESGLS